MPLFRQFLWLDQLNLDPRQLRRQFLLLCSQHINRFLIPRYLSLIIPHQIFQLHLPFPQVERILLQPFLRKLQLYPQLTQLHAQLSVGLRQLAWLHVLWLQLRFQFLDLVFQLVGFKLVNLVDVLWLLADCRILGLER